MPNDSFTRPMSPSGGASVSPNEFELSSHASVFSQPIKADRQGVQSHSDAGQYASLSNRLGRALNQAHQFSQVDFPDLGSVLTQCCLRDDQDVRALARGLSKALAAAGAGAAHVQLALDALAEDVARLDVMLAQLDAQLSARQSSMIHDGGAHGAPVQPDANPVEGKMLRLAALGELLLVREAAVQLRHVLAELKESPQELVFVPESVASDDLPAVSQTHFEEMLLQDPNNIVAMVGLAQALRAASRLEEALECINKAINLQPNHAEALLTRGDVLADLAQGVPARESFTQALDVLQPRLSGRLFGASIFWDPVVANQAGRALLALGRGAEAQKMFEHLLMNDPGDVKARLGVADALALQKRVSESVPHYQHITQSTPDQAAAWMGLARSAQVQGRSDEACQAYLSGAQVCFKKGRLEQSFQCYRQVLLIDPANVAALTGAGFVLERMNRSSEAAGYFCQAGRVFCDQASFHDALRVFGYALVASPFHVGANVGRGEALLGKGDATQALHCFERVLHDSPDNPPALLGKGEALLRGWDYLSAQACFDRVLEQDPSSLRALAGSGEVCLRSGAHAMAVYWFELAKQVDPSHVQVVLGLARCALAQGQPEAALSGFEAVLAQQPGHVAAQEGMAAALRLVGADVGTLDHRLQSAQFLQSRGDAQGVRQLLSQVVKMHPDHADAWLGLAEAERDLGDLHGAVFAFERGVTLRPTDLSAQLGLSRVYLLLGDAEGALDRLEEAQAIAPSDVSIVQARGEALVKMKRYEEALDCFVRVLTHNETHLAALLGKGDALIGLGELDAAQRMFSSVLGIDPGNAHALERLSDIRSGKLPSRQRWS